MMGVLARLQHELADQKDVVLVSFSVDPKRDSPEVLQQYAGRYGADADRWLFLTGDQDKVYSLIKDGFKLGLAQQTGPDVKSGSEVLHSSRLAVVDRQGQIRGSYDALDEGKRAELKQKVAALLREKP
jgi:cytochrome oxidase Cu insertion factor (SCO1/SenC/PrrC family)